MGTWLIRKPEPRNVQGVCVTCSERPQRKTGACYKAQCGPCYKKRFRQGVRKKYRSYPNADQRFKRSHKKTKCENCYFVAEHSCQLDIDHIDGNNQNNEISNLQTLCANCHRLKTYQNKDWESK